MVKARKYVVNKRFQGVPKREDFDLVEYELPPLKNGDILVKAQFISVDPYMRAYNASQQTPYDQFGFQVGVVEESKDPNYPVGTTVVTHKGWCTYSIVNEKDTAALRSAAEFSVYKLPDLKGQSISLGLSAVGMVGATAYFGLLEICKPKAGETVAVTGAAGAVGVLVGQIAKIKGCRVIGFAGSDDKVAWLENEIGFDKAYNYKTVDINKALSEGAPKGVDCYFDNVGGEISSTIINHMNLFGRVSVCGCISSYNEVVQPKASILQPALVFKQLKIEGFLVNRWIEQWPEALNKIATWVKNGDIKVKEHITVGFDKIYDAFIGMLAGENSGKAIVKV